MDKDLAIVINIAKEAGQILLKYFRENLQIEYKQDEFDPVTRADKESDAFIRKALSAEFSADEVLSEENDARPSSYHKRVWMVDPLDGTKDFVGGRGSFAVMIGLLDHNIPSLGVIYNPVTKELFYATIGNGAFLEYQQKTTGLHVNNNADLAEAVLVTRNQVSGDLRPLDKQLDALAVLVSFSGHNLMAQDCLRSRNFITSC